MTCSLGQRGLGRATLAALVALLGLTLALAGPAVAQPDKPSGQRGSSGLPPGPGNPIAKLQKQLAAIQARFGPAVLWINHLDLLPGDLSVVTSFNAISSGVGDDLSGLIIESTTTGDVADGGVGNKTVEKGLQVPPGYLVTGVRLCYELSSASSFFTQVRIAQLQDPPSGATVRLDDGTNLTDPGPVCVDTETADPAIDPAGGALRLSLRVDFGDITDRIVLRGLGLHLTPTGP